MFLKALFIGFLATSVAATHSWEEEKHEAPQPYRFGYEVKDKEGSQYRHEEADGHGSVKGSYGYTDEKGIYREVQYVADKSGFRARVKTNEPGTANQDPADVKIEAKPQIQEVHGVHVIPDIVPVYHKSSSAPHKNVPVYREHVQSYHKPASVKHYQKINNDGFKVQFSPLHGFSYKPSFESKFKSHFNLDNSFKKDDEPQVGSYKFHVPHYRNLHGLNNGYNGDIKFDADIQKILDELKTKGRYSDDHGSFSVDQQEIEKIIEELKNKGGYSGNFRHNGDFDFKFRDLGLNKDRSLFD